jgi:ABC-type cobalamin/Fe3+-siderophores transport system ATPase subunit
MLTNIKIENFKKLGCISFPLSQSVVIIGPNNSGKSTIFQALCLWEIGVKNYIAAFKKKDLNRLGACTINRKDLLNSPISDARFLWKGKKVTQRNNSGAGQTHVPLSVELEGDNKGLKWSCKAEFTFSNAESFSCKIISGLQQIVELYENDYGIHFGFLQPMSGISTTEDKLTQGSIDRKLGEGKTAEVLRNICFEILNPETVAKNNLSSEENWTKLCNVIKLMFGAILQKPEFIKATGLISLEYIENDIKYDISSGGRGFQQTLLLFSYMFANPNTILLLDEPDAHLEVIRQREAFQRINEIASETNSQILVASHSEIVLDEAAEASKVIALIENQTFELNTSTNSQSIRYIKKALTEIGWEKRT